jgi:hypothetical protein
MIRPITWKQGLLSAAVVVLLGIAAVIPNAGALADTTCEHNDHGHFPGTSGKNERYIFWEHITWSGGHYHRYWHEYTDLSHTEYHSKTCPS